jgi:hypothetical protein
VGEAAKPAGEAAKGAPAEGAKPAQPDPKIARAFAELQQKEIKLTEERRKFSSERTSIKKQLDEVKAKQALLAEAGKDPEKALAALGMTYDQLVEWKLNQEHATPESKTKAEIEEAKSLAKKNAEALEEFKQAQEEKEQAQTKAQKEAAQADLDESRRRFYQGAVAFVKSNVADYYLTDKNNAHAEVAALVEEVYKRTSKYDENGNLVTPGRVMPLKEAAGMIEKHFETLAEEVYASEQWKQRQAKKSAAKAPPAEQQEEEKQGEPAQRSTVDNSLTATTKPTGQRSHPKRETEDERIARAVAKYKEVKDADKTKK